MKILFAAPYAETTVQPVPQKGLAYLASVAREAGHQVNILDCRLEMYCLEDFEKKFMEEKPDLFGIRVLSSELHAAQCMIESAKKLRPSTIAVIGGPHSTSEDPQRLFDQFPALDYAFAGEGEPGLKRFLTCVETNDTDYTGIPGLIWRDENGFHKNESALVEDLDSLPLPAWDLIDPRRYQSACSIMAIERPVAPITTTRGCPFHCTFCASHLITGRKVRKRGMDSIFAELRMLKEQFGVRTIDITDENFAFDKQFVMDFCARMHAEKLDLAWNCPIGIRINSLDEEVVRAMESAGCFAISVGVESGSQRILNAIKKSLKVEQVVEKVTMVKRCSNMVVHGHFVLGFPNETAEDLQATINLACSLPFDVAAFYLLRPIPGTEIYQELLAAGKVVDALDLEHYNSWGSFCTLSDKELVAFYKKAYFRFYSRPSVAFKLFRQIGSFSQIRILITGVLRLAFASWRY